jgi:hypothetical protein
VVLYECLAGPNCLPYFDDDTRRFLEKIVLSRFRPILEWAPDLDPGAAAIVERMIAPKADRYEDMSELVRDMQRYLNRDAKNPDVAALAAPTPDPAPEPVLAVAASRGVSGLTLGLGFAALAAVGSVAWLTAQVSSLQRQLGIQMADSDRLTSTAINELCQAHLDHARRLAELESHAEAKQLCTLAINRARTRNLSGLLADAYRLRGEIRTVLNEDGAAADIAEAERLEAKGAR